MINRRNYAKSEIFLMEFIVVVMFFAICVSICLSAFVKANSISDQSRTLNHALMLAQSTAETIKAAAGYDDVADSLGGGYYDDKYYVEVETEVSKSILTADIIVYDGKEPKKEQEICRLQVKKYLQEEV